MLAKHVLRFKPSSFSWGESPWILPLAPFKNGV